MKAKATGRQTGSGKRGRRDAVSGKNNAAAKANAQASTRTMPQPATSAASVAAPGRVAGPRPATHRRRKGWQREVARLRSAVPMPAWLAAVVGAEAAIWVVLLLAVPIIAVGLTLTVDLRLDGLRVHASLPWIDNDYWWHLATGNWIIETGKAPTADLFSWTMPGADWVAHEWLAEIVFALTDRAAGYAGGIVLTALVAIAGFWFLVSAMRIYGLSRLAICLLMLIWGGAFLRSGVLVVRPQVLTFAFLAILFAAIAAHDTGRRRTLWLLPPLFLVWVNMNLTVLIGIVCLGAYGLDRLVRGRLDRHLVTVGVLSGLVLLVNPRGPDLLIAALKYSDSDALRYQYVLEWMKPDLGDRTHLPFVLALPVAALAAWQLVRLRVWPALPLLILLYQSFTAIRFIPIYVMLAFVFAGWWYWQRQERRQLGPRRSRPAPVAPLAPRKVWVLAPPLAATALVLTIAVRDDASQFRREPVAWGYPVRAASILMEQYPEARLFNVYDYGGYLLYRFDGRNEVYVDGREEMYGEDHLRHYFSLIYGEPGWRETFEAEGVDAVLIRHIDGLSRQIQEDPAWERVYSDNYSALYVRVRPSGDIIGG